MYHFDTAPERESGGGGRRGREEEREGGGKRGREMETEGRRKGWERWKGRGRGEGERKGREEGEAGRYEVCETEKAMQHTESIIVRQAVP